MSPTHDGTSRSSGRLVRLRGWARKKSSIAILGLVGLTAVVVAIDQMTPQPYVAVFRALMKLAPDAVNIGPYRDKVANVETIATARVPVADYPDANLTVYAPSDRSGAAMPVVLYIHGGGWVMGSAGQVASYAKLLASNGYVVANLEYALAPEYRYPAPIVQSVAAINYLREHARDYGADATRFFIGGNSAGAQIAAQLGALVTNPKLQHVMKLASPLRAADLRGLILFNGVYDFDTVGRDNFPGFRKYAWSYTGQKDYENFPRLDELSTARNVTTAYPATFLTAGDADPIEAQTYQFDAILRAHHVDVSSLYWTGSARNLPHDYVYQLDNRAARAAYANVIAFLAGHSR